MLARLFNVEDIRNRLFADKYARVIKECNQARISFEKVDCCSVLIV